MGCRNLDCLMNLQDASRMVGFSNFISKVDCNEETIGKGKCNGIPEETECTYTYMNGNYSISVAADCKAGETLLHKSNLEINLPKDICIFTTNPFYKHLQGADSSYWMGSVSTPRTVAYKNFAAEIYDIRHLRHGRRMTHLFFPCEKFDEVDCSNLQDGLLLGRVAGVNICIFTNRGVDFTPIDNGMKNDTRFHDDTNTFCNNLYEPYDLVNHSRGVHYYMYIVDNKMHFKDFCARVEESELYSFGSYFWLDYKNSRYELSYKGRFIVDDVEVYPNIATPSFEG